jgi:hypothetical protein
MSIPVALRSDFEAVRLRRLARQSRDARPCSTDRLVNGLRPSVSLVKRCG